MWERKQTKYFQALKMTGFSESLNKGYSIHKHSFLKKKKILTKNTGVPDLGRGGLVTL